jgi:hypothetical protein
MFAASLTSYYGLGQYLRSGLVQCYQSINWFEGGMCRVMSPVYEAVTSPQ